MHCYFRVWPNGGPHKRVCPAYISPFGQHCDSSRSDESINFNFLSIFALLSWAACFSMPCKSYRFMSPTYNSFELLHLPQRSIGWTSTMWAGEPWCSTGRRPTESSLECLTRCVNAQVNVDVDVPLFLTLYAQRRLQAGRQGSPRWVSVLSSLEHSAGLQ